MNNSELNITHNTEPTSLNLIICKTLEFYDWIVTFLTQFFNGSAVIFPPDVLLSIFYFISLILVGFIVFTYITGLICSYRARFIVVKYIKKIYEKIVYYVFGMDSDTCLIYQSIFLKFCFYLNCLLILVTIVPVFILGRSLPKVPVYNIPDFWIVFLLIEYFCVSMVFKEAIDKYYKLPYKKQTISFKPFMNSPITSLIFSLEVVTIYLMVPTYSNIVTMVYFVAMTLDIKIGHGLIEYILQEY